MLSLHPVAGKQKAVDICNAFATGAPSNAVGDVFFGVNHANIGMLRSAKAQRRDWWYIDNSYFDRHRGVYFRVTKNALQCSGVGDSDGARFADLNIPIKPWRAELGPDILVCSQSESFMHTAAGYRGNWTEDVLTALRAFGADMGRVRVRPWSPDKVKVGLALLADLSNIKLLVTHSSASAITSMLEGIPAISQEGAATLLTGHLTALSLVCLPRPAGRKAFASVLADNQFTLQEMKDGIAWAKLNE